MAKKKIITKKDKLKLNAKDIGVRALKTFIQTLLASAGTVIVATDFETQKQALLVAVVSAGAAAISVVQNALSAVVDK